MEHPAKGGKSSRSALTTVAVLGFAAAGLFAKRTVVTSPASRQPAPASTAGEPASPSAGGGAPPVPHKPGLFGLAMSIFDRMGRDNITLAAAGVAFYVMLAIFPALAMMVSLYALVADPTTVAQHIQEYGGLLPAESMKLLTDGLNSFAQKSTSQLSLALIVSILLALWSARNGISSVMTGLNIAYEETEQRSFIMQTLVSLVLTFAGVIFAVLVFVAVPVVPVVLNLLHVGGFATVLVNLLRWPVLAVFVALGFAVIYRFAPSRSHPRWRWISWGAGIATVCWLVGSILFSIYVSKFGSYDATYGSLGAVVVLLLWFWVSALVLLVGAEIDAEIDTRATATSSPMGGLAPSAGPPGKRVTAEKPGETQHR